MLIRPFTDENGTRWYSNGRVDDVMTNDSGEPIVGPDGRPQHNPKVRAERYEKYFQRVFDSRSRALRRELGSAGDDALKAEVAKRTIVVLRAHQDAHFKDVYEILNKSRRAGFNKMQLRATMETKSP